MSLEESEDARDMGASIPCSSEKCNAFELPRPPGDTIGRSGSSESSSSMSFNCAFHENSNLDSPASSLRAGEMGLSFPSNSPFNSLFISFLRVNENGVSMSPSTRVMPDDSGAPGGSELGGTSSSKSEGPVLYTMGREDELDSARVAEESRSGVNWGSLRRP